MSSSAPPVFKIVPGLQSYAWGKKGSSSLAAQLGTTSIPDFSIDEEKPYAELWMGTHPNVPSTLTSDPSTTLASHISANPSVLGDKVASKFEVQDGNLPFLFKVLSIGTALSIQAHPDKQLAQRLFKDHGDIYKDPNHKPEMAIALTPFLAFLNFLPCQTILLHLLTVPELQSLIPSELVTELAQLLTLPTTLPPDEFLFQPTKAAPNEAQKECLKKIFAALMSTPEDKYTQAVKQLVERYSTSNKEEDVVDSEKGLVDLALMLNDQYPGDIGILCVFMLNVVELKEGEAAFLGANMPHAYIKGDIIECMATSDNVVRAGLTPKLRDVETLIDMLTYEAGPASQQLLRPTPFSAGDESAGLLYDPPIDEFSVLKIALGASGASATSETSGTSKQRAVDGPSICVVTKGQGSVTTTSEAEAEAEAEGKEEVRKGDVVFIAANTPVQWTTADGQELEVFRAFVEVN